MNYNYTTQRLPKDASPIAHNALLTAGFQLVSFYRSGHEAGHFNYRATIGGVTLHASASPSFDGGHRTNIFLAESVDALGNFTGRQLAQVKHSELCRLDFAAAAKAWAAIRPTPNGPGKINAARDAAVTALYRGQ